MVLVFSPVKKTPVIAFNVSKIPWIDYGYGNPTQFCFDHVRNIRGRPERERERIIQGSGSPSPIIEEILKNFYFQ